VIPRLHLVTDDSIIESTRFITRALGAMEAGGSRLAFHLRGPRSPGRRIFELGRTLAKEARRRGTLLLVNDRLDVALALDLAGAHLGQRSLPPPQARALLGGSRCLGLSVHDRQEGFAGGGGLVDFFFVGALFPTTSHPSSLAGGVERLLEVAATDPPPMVGIGGVTPGKVQEIVKAGGHGVAVRGGIWDSPDPGAAVGVYLVELERWPSGLETVHGGPGAEDQEG